MFHGSVDPGGIAGDRRDVLPASEFAFSTKKIWDLIKEDKDLDLPAFREMVATFRCDQISKEKIDSMNVYKDWCQLKNDEEPAQFGFKLNAILSKCLSEYDEETVHFDEKIRKPKREFLETELVKIVKPVYEAIMRKIRSATLDDFKKDFDKALGKEKNGFADAARKCKQSSLSVFDERVQSKAIDSPKQIDSAIILQEFNPSNFREKLDRDIDEHVDTVRSIKLEKLIIGIKEKLHRALEERIKTHLDRADNETWPQIRMVLGKETRSLIHKDFSNAFSELHLGDGTRHIQELEEYAKGVVESEARSAEKTVLSRMKDRFEKSLRHYPSLTVWKRNRDITAVAEAGRRACVRLLAVLAAMRLTEKADENNKIASILEDALLGASSSSLQLVSDTWDEANLPPNTTLISPVKCKEFWARFLVETEKIATQAIDKKYMEGNQ